MSHWNYRVIRFESGGEAYSAIHEVHYDDDGNLKMYSANPAVVMWEEEGRGGMILGQMAEAFMRRVLTPEDFDK